MGIELVIIESIGSKIVSADSALTLAPSSLRLMLDCAPINYSTQSGASEPTFLRVLHVIIIIISIIIIITIIIIIIKPSKRHQRLPLARQARRVHSRQGSLIAMQEREPSCQFK